jgi:hypothetical protein
MAAATLMLLLLALSLTVQARPSTGKSAVVASTCVSVEPETENIRSLTREEVAAFHRDGYVLAKGLVQGGDLETLQKACEQTLTKEHPWDKFTKNSYRKVDFNTLISDDDLRRIATELPVSQLMGSSLLGGKTRVLKDAFLTYQPGLQGCGWHVDDTVFWPTPLKNFGHEGMPRYHDIVTAAAAAAADDDDDDDDDERTTMARITMHTLHESLRMFFLFAGVNAWIALSPYRREHGGGLAIAPTSNRAKWMKKARHILRTTRRTCRYAGGGGLDAH